MARMVVVYIVVIAAMVFRPELMNSAIFWFCTIPTGILSLFLDFAEYSVLEKQPLRK